MAPVRPAALHWPEYAIEAGAIGTFMVSAAVFAAVFYHPSSPMAAMVTNDLVRRLLMGLAMGLTAVSIVYSPLGQRSGAHMNPAMTLTFYRLGKVARTDLVGYAVAQFTGAAAGMALVTAILRGVVSAPSVNYVTTMPGMPGPGGEAVAFGAETGISFVLMLTVLIVSNQPRFARFTGLCAGALVWTYITLESPLSGMSMNPARTLGSALLAWNFPGLWIYFTAPPLGMLLAAELFTRRHGMQRVVCAKLHHPHRPHGPHGPHGASCIFGCGAGVTAR